VEALQTLLDIMPDEIPCILSVLQRKPCREVCSFATHAGKSYRAIFSSRYMINDVLSYPMLELTLMERNLVPQLKNGELNLRNV
jgi:hypothetical protein